MVSNWKDIPLETRKKMLERNNLVDDKGRPIIPLTRKIKMMLANQLNQEEKRSNIVTK